MKTTTTIHQLTPNSKGTYTEDPTTFALIVSSVDNECLIRIEMGEVHAVFPANQVEIAISRAIQQ